MATFVVLSMTGGLVATVGRRRQGKGRKQSKAVEVEALTEHLGRALAQLVGASVELRDALEDAADAGRKMVAIEAQLSGHHRRPLWRQIEDGNYSHALGGLRGQIGAWLEALGALSPSERQLFDLLQLSPAPVAALMDLLEASGLGLGVLAGEDSSSRGDRRERVELLGAHLAEGIACLSQIERELCGYREGGYR